MQVGNKYIPHLYVTSGVWLPWVYCTNDYPSSLL